MAEVRLSRSASADFDRLFDYLVVHTGSTVARRYARDIRSAINALADFPALGFARPELGDMTRIVVVHPYLVIYDYHPSDPCVIVLRILHGARQLTEQLLAQQ